MLFCLAPLRARADFAQVEAQFRELPRDARQWVGPLFWLHGGEPEGRLAEYVAKVAEAGNGSFTTESRPHRDWLGPEWFRDLHTCLQEAKRHGLQMWIFDERWWPSQEVGGKVPTTYAAKKLVATAREVQGGEHFSAQGLQGATEVALLAGRVTGEGKIDGNSLLDLSGEIREGRIDWLAPAGRWRVMRFTHELAPALGQTGHLSVDGLSPECVQWYLDTVYQPHYDHFKEEFGKTIAGFFYDEPETRGDWGSGLPPVLAEAGVDWKKAYVAYLFQLSGDEQEAARFAYLDARAETWGRTMYGMIHDWCAKRGVQSIGHFMEHANLYANLDFCAGDMMKLQKYSSMGGIDMVFDQFVMGLRDTPRDAPVWQTPKLGSSISHVYGKTDDRTMVEIFGARGQDLTYPEMKWWTDAMHVAGVNFLIPHSFNPRAPFDTDCPPYFYNGGHEPRFPLYRIFANYTSRLQTLLTGGRHVAPVALVTPGLSVSVGKHITTEKVSENLQDALYDCDWIPYEVLEKDMRIEGSSLKLHGESYPILFLPAVEVIPFPVLEKAREFFQEGGLVVTHGFLPTKSATLGRTAADVSQLVRDIWGDAQPSLAASRINAAGGRSYLLPARPEAAALRHVFGTEAKLRPSLDIISGKTNNWVHVLHRVKEGRDVFFVTNQNINTRATRYQLSIAAKGVPELWDAMRNEIHSLPHEQRDGRVEISLTLQPNESKLIVFQPEKRNLPAAWEFESDRMGLRGLRPVALPHHRTCGFPHPAVEQEKITAQLAVPSRFPMVR